MDENQTPQSTVNPNALTPSAFKERIVNKYPNGVDSSGKKYSEIDPVELTQRIVSKYPNGVTNDGHKYSDFLGTAPVSPTPQVAPKTDQGVSNLGNDTFHAVGGFLDSLFPAVGDVGNLLMGKNKKSLGQLVGDVGLTALPFVPGLGEEAILGKGASMFARSGLGAATGYGIGVSQGLSEGKSVGQAANPLNPTNIISTLVGGATPKAVDEIGKALGLAGNSLNGVSKPIENALKESGITPEQVTEYANATKSHATDPLNTPSTLSVYKKYVKQATDFIDEAVRSAGSNVGAAKKTLGSVSMPDISKPVQAFLSDVEDRFGLTFAPGEDGVMKAIPLPDRTPSIDASEMARLENTYNKVLKLAGSTARNGTDVISFIDNDLNSAYKNWGANKVADPIDGTMSQLRKGINESIRQVAPDLATANDAHTAAKALQTEKNQAMGSTNQRSSLVAKRLFSGDFSDVSQELFDKIFEATGINLKDHALLSKFFSSASGDPTQQTLLQQMIQSGATSGSPLETLYKLGISGAKSLMANPEQYAKNAISGAPGGILDKLLQKAAPYLPGVGSRVGAGTASTLSGQ